MLGRPTPPYGRLGTHHFKGGSRQSVAARGGSAEDRLTCDTANKDCLPLCEQRSLEAGRGAAEPLRVCSRPNRAGNKTRPTTVGCQRKRDCTRFQRRTGRIALHSRQRKAGFARHSGKRSCPNRHQFAEDRLQQRFRILP